MKKELFGVFVVLSVIANAVLGIMKYNDSEKLDRRDATITQLERSVTENSARLNSEREEALDRVERWVWERHDHVVNQAIASARMRRTHTDLPQPSAGAISLNDPEGGASLLLFPAEATEIEQADKRLETDYQVISNLGRGGCGEQNDRERFEGFDNARTCTGSERATSGRPIRPTLRNSVSVAQQQPRRDPIPLIPARFFVP